MKTIHVDRYLFTIEEVVAAVLPNLGRTREMEMRIDPEGYVAIDIVPPADRESVQPEQSAVASERREEEKRPAENQQVAQGPIEFHARQLCAASLFRAFLGCKTEEAAHRLLLDRVRVQSLADLDRSRSNAMNLQHVVEEFEAWKIT